MNTSEYFCSRITLSRWAMALSGTIGYQNKGTEQSIGHIFANCQSRLSYKIIPNNFRVLLLLLVTHIDWWLVTIAEESPYLLSKVWWLILLVSLIDVLEKKVFLQICLWPCVLVIFLIIDLVPGFSPLGEMPLCHFFAFSSYSYIKNDWVTHENMPWTAMFCIAWVQKPLLWGTMEYRTNIQIHIQWCCEKVRFSNYCKTEPQRVCLVQYRRNS